jgi:methylthioribulose-1-phosphate dehydratase
MTVSQQQAVQLITQVARRLDARGLSPATAGNYSMRLSQGRIAITVSGRHKGRLGPGDVMLVDGNGHALEEQTPSAETGLHTSLYRLYPHVNAVLHVHSVVATALTLALPRVSEIVLSGYEMLKVFPGVTTHTTTVRVPVFDNSQDIETLATQIARQLPQHPHGSAYLLRGHGAYAWGRDMDEAERVVEALEHLLQCELEVRRVKAGGNA